MLQQLQGELWGIDTFQLATWGDIKTCKTTLGLTFPKPIIMLDLDRGFHRAKQRFTQFKILELQIGEALSLAHIDSGAEIIVVPYQVPIKFPGQRSPETLTLWNQIIQDVRTGCGHPLVRTIYYDTGSVLWLLCREAHLERILSENANRQTLNQYEYTKPNAEMRALYTMPKAWGKNLIIAHHMSPKYEEVQKSGNALGTEKQQTGWTWDGWNRVGGVVDVIGQTYIDRNGTGSHPSVIIETCGLTLAAEGKVIQAPTGQLITHDMVLSTIIAERYAEMTRGG